VSVPYVGWGITYQGSLMVSTIRQLRKFAIEDYLKDIDLPVFDWKGCLSAGCKVVRVWVCTERPVCE
jgi:hypothetical protein